jgi:hypothetical protein
MTDRKIKVFIRSSLSEFDAIRSAVVDAIQSIPLLELIAEEPPPDNPGAMEEYLRKLRNSAIYIGLFGEYSSESAQQEYLAACENPYRQNLIYIKKSNQLELLEALVRDRSDDRHTITQFQTLADILPLFPKQFSDAVNRATSFRQLLAGTRPVAHSSGKGRSVLEQRWMNQQAQLAELFPPLADRVEFADTVGFGASTPQETQHPSSNKDTTIAGGAAGVMHSVESISQTMQHRASSAKEASSTIYPNITPSSEHPLQGSTIDITVSLDFKRHGPTAGVVQLPQDEVEHRIDVHLLFGAVSLWGTLTFQRPAGTTEPARFGNLAVPLIGEDGRNVVPESVLADIIVNFYLNNRWCGEGLLAIEILARKNSQPLAAIEQKQIMPWRQTLCVSPDSAPPDLLVRIQLKNGQLKWSLLSPHMSFRDLPAAELESDLGDLPFRFVKTNFEVFTGAPLTDEQMDDLDSKCDRIYAATATGFKKAYWRLFRASRQAGGKVKLESIQFVSDEPYIPWELMRVWDKDNPDQPPEILGVTHAVGRWMAGDSCELRQELTINKIAVCATSYKDIPNIQPLPWAEEERKYLHNHFATFDVKMVRAEVKSFLETGTADAVHFSCHGDMSAQQPEDSSLELEDNKIKPGLVGRPETRLGIGRSKPLVFLNACQVGGAGRTLGLVFGWPQAFLNIGSTACIAPLWSVIDENARDIAEEFYQMTLVDSTPKSLGQALQSIRQQWRKKRSLTYLGYVLYGDPMARIRR